MRKPENNFPEPTFYSAIPSGFLFLQVIWGRPALKSSKLQLSSRRVALNLTQNTFPLCRKKIPPILFAGATRPKSSKIQLTQGGSPRTPRKILSRCAVRKSPLYFCRGDPPQVFQIPTYSRRVAPNPTQNTFPLCRKKILPILFVGATPHKKIHSH